MIILSDDKAKAIRLCKESKGEHFIETKGGKFLGEAILMSDIGHTVFVSGEEAEKYLDENNIYYLHLEKIEKENFSRWLKRLSKLIDEHRDLLAKDYAEKVAKRKPTPIIDEPHKEEDANEGEHNGANKGCRMYVEVDEDSITDDDIEDIWGLGLKVAYGDGSLIIYGDGDTLEGYLSTLDDGEDLIDSMYGEYGWGCHSEDEENKPSKAKEGNREELGCKDEIDEEGIMGILEAFGGIAIAAIVL